MTSRTRRRSRFTLMALCCLLLAHWSLLVHACPLIQQAGTLVGQAAVAAEHGADVVADCHGGAVSPDDDVLPSLCWKHCADEGGASNGTGSVFGVAAAPPRVLRLQVPALHLPQHWQSAPTRREATAPPLSILYCVSRT